MKDIRIIKDSLFINGESYIIPKIKKSKKKITLLIGLMLIEKIEFKHLGIIKEHLLYEEK